MIQFQLEAGVQAKFVKAEKYLQTISISFKPWMEVYRNFLSKDF